MYEDKAEKDERKLHQTVLTRSNKNVGFRKKSLTSQAKSGISSGLSFK